jgi:hypothetical protein
VLVLGADAEDNLADVVTKLSATGRFDFVTSFNAFTGIPDLPTLQQYQGVLVWSNYPFFDAHEYGNLLADYVDGGGGVVVAALATGQANGFTTTWLSGRWTTGSYQVLIPDGDFIYGTATLGTVLEAHHPVMQGVQVFHGGSASARSMNTTLSSGSRRIANWSDGSVLVAVNYAMQTPRIDLNFMPPSNDVYSEMWHADTDGALLMANALSRVAGVGRPFLSSNAATAGGLLTLDLDYLQHASSLVTLLSIQGAGPTQTPFGACAVSRPWAQTPLLLHGNQPQFSISFTIPTTLAGRTIYSQTLELSGAGFSGWSNPLAVAVAP